MIFFRAKIKFKHRKMKVSGIITEKKRENKIKLRKKMIILIKRLQKPFSSAILLFVSVNRLKGNNNLLNERVLIH